MKRYDFDAPVERKGTGCVKHDGMVKDYGTNDLVPLWVADMDFEVADEIADALHKRTGHRVYGYSVVPDSFWKSIFRWWRKRHGLTITRDQIIYIPGIVKGIGILLNFYTQKGDKVVVQPPVYHPFRRLVEGNGRVALSNPLVETPEGWKMDLEGLARIMREEKPKMMILCNPQNPIGIQWDMETLREVARLAHENGVIVVSDEIHGDLMLQGRDHIPYLCAGPDAVATGIMLGAPSKTFNIPGLVSSWCVIKNPELRKPFFEWMEVNEFDAPTQMATIATEAAYDFGADWLDQVLEYLQGNVEAMEEWLKRELPQLKIVRPQASFLVWLDMRSLGLGEPELEDLVINKAGLAVNPGAMFGEGGDGFARVNIALPRKRLLEALEKLKKAVEKQ